MDIKMWPQVWSSDTRIVLVREDKFKPFDLALITQFKGWPARHQLSCEGIAAGFRNPSLLNDIAQYIDELNNTEWSDEPRCRARKEAEAFEPQDIPGYGVVSTPYMAAAFSDSERLVHSTIYDLIYNHLSYLSRDRIGDHPLTVYLYTQAPLTHEDVKQWTDYVEEDLLLALNEDEDLGNPEEEVNPENLEACRSALQSAVTTVLENWPRYNCDLITTIKVDPVKWAEKHMPRWLDPEAQETQS